MAEHTFATSSFVLDLGSKFTEPNWLSQAREQAWSHYEAAPTPYLEKTDLSKRTWGFAGFPVEKPEALPEAEAFVQATNEPTLLIVDGMVKELKIPSDWISQGIIFTDIHTAIREHSDLVQKYLFSVVKTTEEKWTALNAALFYGGAFLYVPRGVKVEMPFQLVYSDSNARQGAFARSLVVGEELSSFTLSELHFTQSEQASGQTYSHVTEVVAQNGSHITFSAVDHLQKGPTHFTVRRARVERDAIVDWVIGDVGDGFSVSLVESVLNGDGSCSNTRALGVGYGRQHHDFTASMVHVGRFSESDIVMHGVLRDRANAIFRSRTQIVKGAVGAGSEQSDRMIMIDGSARADAIPMLLIDENDVKRCGHAASVGKIDPNQMYYLMSRGIPQTTAMQMIIWGYLQETVESLPGESLQNILTARIERELSR